MTYLERIRDWTREQPWFPKPKVLNGYATTALLFVAVHLGLGADDPFVVYAVPMVAGAVVSWWTKS